MMIAQGMRMAAAEMADKALLTKEAVKAKIDTHNANHHGSAKIGREKTQGILALVLDMDETVYTRNNNGILHLAPRTNGTSSHAYMIHHDEAMPGHQPLQANVENRCLAMAATIALHAASAA